MMKGQKYKSVFLDRDGTLIEDRGYISNPEQVSLLPGVAEGLKMLVEKGFKLIVITNQSGIGRGYYDETNYRRVNERLNFLLEPFGISLHHFYFCPHDPSEGCPCRK